MYRELVLRHLRNLITSDYILLDLPYYTNVGDILLWQSAEDLLKELPYKCLYASSLTNYQKPRISKDVVIVFTAGGNFGDLWERHQVFRHQVLTDFPENPIVQLPQSVWFDSEEKMKQDIKLYSEHKGHVTICVRDQNSFDTIMQNYCNVETILLPDLALTFDVEKYCKRRGIKTKERGEGALLVKRNDKELSEDSSLNAISESITYISDWPPMLSMIKEEEWLNRLTYRMSWMKIPQSFIRKFTDFYYSHILKDAYLISGIYFLLQYETVYSTRLHAAVLAMLLGKQTYLLDNSYGKCHGVFDLWMKDYSNLKMV